MLPFTPAHRAIRLGLIVACVPRRRARRGGKGASELRREWDSNPRRVSPEGFSRASHSAALPSLRSPGYAPTTTSVPRHRSPRLGPAAQQASPDEDRHHHITTSRPQASDRTRTPWLIHGRASCARRGVDPTDPPLVASGGMWRREHCSGRTSIGGASSGTDVHPRLGRLGQPVGASPSQPRPPELQTGQRARPVPPAPSRARPADEPVRRSDGQTVMAQRSSPAPP